jgi:hypothetical protein
MIFNSTERCILKRPSLLQLHSAITRLENEGWARDQTVPELTKPSVDATNYWWIGMRRSVPSNGFGFTRNESASFPPAPERRSVRFGEEELQYPKAAGLI